MEMRASLSSATRWKSNEINLLQSDHVRKSVSAEVNYGVRFAADHEMFKFSRDLSIEVARRMEEVQVHFVSVL